METKKKVVLAFSGGLAPYRMFFRNKVKKLFHLK